MQIEIQVVDDPKIQKHVHGSRYKTFLNPRQKMLEVAEECRKEYLSTALDKI